MSSTVTTEAQAIFDFTGAFRQHSLALPIRDNSVVVRVTHCGVCHSDVHTVDGDWGDKPFPLVPGHEIIGHVVECGKDVDETRIYKGLRVGIGPQGGSLCYPGGDKCVQCQKGDDNYCTVGYVKTYGSTRQNGDITQGGFATIHVTDERFVIPIPEALRSDVAAPLLCAGITTYAPMKDNHIGPSSSVAVVGMGGLGHMAIKFAAAFQCKTVAAISRSDKKLRLAQDFGANLGINTRADVRDALKEHDGKFDLVIVTASADIDWDAYLDILAPRGCLHIVGVPPSPVQFHLRPILNRGTSVSSSHIGSPKEISEMLEFCVEHKVYPMIEVMPLHQVEEAIGRVRDAKAKFRVVLEVPSEESGKTE